MVERVVYVGSIMQVIVHLAPGQTLQAWVQNQGEGLPYGQGHPVSVHLPRRRAPRPGRHERARRSRTEDPETAQTFANSETPRSAAPGSRVGTAKYPSTIAIVVVSSRNVAAALTAGVGSARVKL